MTDSIDIEALTSLLANSTSVTLIDVRRMTDVEAVPKIIQGAAWRDPENIDAWAEQLPVGKRTVVYCVKGGSVSRSVADRLKKEGLDAVFLEGGLKKWIDDDRPTEDI